MPESERHNAKQQKEHFLVGGVILAVEVRTLEQLRVSTMTIITNSALSITGRCSFIGRSWQTQSFVLKLGLG